MRAATKSVNCFGLGWENIPEKNCFKFFQSCVTLRPKHEPLQLLLSEGVDHTFHLVLLAFVGALIGYQDHVLTPGTTVWVSWIHHISPLSCGLKIMAGAVAVGATAALALPLLFSSFSPVDKAKELLPCRWSTVCCVGWPFLASNPWSHSKICLPFGITISTVFQIIVRLWKAHKIRTQFKNLVTERRPKPPMDVGSSTTTKQTLWLQHTHLI